MAYAWLSIVLLCLVMYVLLDGYDLGIGTLMLTETSEARRREMVEIVATAWDGNETWLILFGVCAWAGLPGAYATMLPAVYLPLIVMLFAIIARGAAIELISQSDGVPRRLGLAFGLGSLIAAFAQGMAIGGVLSGVRVHDGVFTGAWHDFFSYFSVLTGLATVVLYVAAGAAFLRLKAEGDLRSRASAAGRVAVGLTAVLAVGAALSLGATAAPYHLHQGGRITLFGILCVVAAGGGVLGWLGFRRTPDRLALTGVVVAEIAGFLALITVLVPRLVPPSITVHDAASPSHTFVVLLVGVGLNIPLVLFYSWYAHHVFRGKYRAPQLNRPAAMAASARALMPTPPPVAATEDGRA